MAPFTLVPSTGCCLWRVRDGGGRTGDSSLETLSKASLFTRRFLRAQKGEREAFKLSSKESFLSRMCHETGIWQEIHCKMILKTNNISKRFVLRQL